jgi:hypothetical protein
MKNRVPERINHLAFLAEETFRATKVRSNRIMESFPWDQAAEAYG